MRSIFAIALLMSILSCAVARAHDARDFGGLKAFKNKAEILKWGTKQLGDVRDTFSFKVDGKDFFVLNGAYKAGCERKVTFVFSGFKSKKTEAWSILCMRNTATTVAGTEIDEANRQVVFKSESGICMRRAIQKLSV